MTKISTTAWTLHNLGLATSIGGTLFGQRAFQPALHDLDQAERARISDEAWTRYSWINLAAHGVVAATWFAGRTLLSGREVDRASRTMTKIKDVLVVTALVTGVTSVILGKMLGKKAQEAGRDGQDASASEQQAITGLRTAVRAVGTANLVTNAAIGAVTTNLSMHAGKSLPFAFVSRFLP